MIVYHIEYRFIIAIAIAIAIAIVTTILAILGRGFLNLNRLVARCIPVILLPFQLDYT